MGIFGKPNIEKLKTDRDIENLGKLLRHKNSDFRRESAQALLDLILDKKTSEDERTSITRLFNGINDKAIVSVFMQNLEEECSKSDFPGEGYPINTARFWAVLLAGGINELIEFHKKIARSTRLLGCHFHEDLSGSLFAYADYKKFGVDKLLHIIPYSVFSATQETINIRKRLEESESLQVKKKDIQEIEQLLKRLPHCPSGMNNYVIYEYGLGKSLLSKLTSKSGDLEIKDSREVDILISNLKDEDIHVRESAAIKLGEIGDKKAVEPLVALLGDPNIQLTIPLDQREAAEALVKMNDLRGLEYLKVAKKREEKIKKLKALKKRLKKDL